MTKYTPRTAQWHRAHFLEAMCGKEGELQVAAILHDLAACEAVLAEREGRIVELEAEKKSLLADYRSLQPNRS